MPVEWRATIDAKVLLFRGIADWHTGSVEMVQNSKTRRIVGLAKVIRAGDRLRDARAICQHCSEMDERVLRQVDEYLGVVEMVTSRVDSKIMFEVWSVNSIRPQ